MTSWYKGTVMAGTGIASGTNGCQDMGGTIRQQRAFFEESGFSFEGLHMGTINVNIEPYEYEILKPVHQLKDCKWHKDWPVETFSMFDCRLRYNGREYKGYVYYPHPETKSTTFFGHSMMEVLAEKIDGIVYGTAIEITIPEDQMSITLTKTDKKAHGG